MTCSKKFAILLHTLLDGELDAANVHHYEKHLVSCALCAAEYGNLKQMRASIRDSRGKHRACEEFRLRIEAAIDHVAIPGDVKKSAGPSQPAPMRPHWWVSGLSLALAASMALFVAISPRGNSLEENLVDSHVRSLLVSHLIDVQSSDRNTVTPWFSGKVDVAPPALDLAEKGFPLVGGRLDYIESRVVAALVYKQNNHVINVFVRAAPDEKDTGPRDVAYHGYNLCQWRQKGIEFWAVTDASQPQLNEFEQVYSRASAEAT
jgi:anti-sigma factor RsiW